MIILLIVQLCSGKIYFSEQFSTETSLSKWTTSKKSNYGKISYYAGNKTCNFTNQGIQTTENNKFYAISANLIENFNTTGRDLIFLYTMRAPERLGCTGSYMKLMPRVENPTNLDDSIPSSIIFGPDVCGTDAEIKLMVEYNRKLYKLRDKVPYMVDDLGTDTHLFTMIIFNNESYEVRLDNKVLKSGDLLTDLDLKEPRIIPDSDAYKPADWDDRKEIPDPEDREPEDWEKEKFTQNENEQKPKDWDNELFGEWQPRVNVNPSYRGDYRPRTIPNPNYMGEWQSPMIKNPYFKPAKDALQFYLGTVAIEVWQVHSKTIFSNILLSDSLSEAEDFVENTFMRIPKTCERDVKQHFEDEL